MRFYLRKVRGACTIMPMTTTRYSHFTTQRLEAEVASLNEMMVELSSRTGTRRTSPGSPVTPTASTETDRVSWLSSAGVAKNGGIRPPGTEGMSASKGTNKPKPKTGKMESAYGEPIKATPVDKPITKGRIIAEGVYKDGEKIVRVRKAQAGHLYGLLWNGTEFKFVSGAMKGMTSDMRVSLEEAKAFGKATGTCMMCQRELTNPDSIELGIGPICLGKF